MSGAGARLGRRLPSVDEVLRSAPALAAIERHGRQSVVVAVRDALAAIRSSGGSAAEVAEIAESAAARLQASAQPSLRPVYNLSGTVLHTNLGRALLAEAAIEAAVEAMRRAVTLEFDLEGGRRGERDDHLRTLLMELSGAADATAVNNNAAAVLLALNSLAKGREAIVSRGELIEIGGSFRLPEVMARAGVRLVEVGTTNRTHLNDYAEAIGPRSGVILKVHSSNYRIQGFTSEVPARALAALAQEHGVPLLHDLGSGTLVDLTRFGLTREPTVAEAVADGADLVTFSGDKLLGGPQAGFLVGSKEAVARCNRNPMKRALRLDKIRIAALEATLRLYRDPDRLAQRLPTLRQLARPQAEIQALAERLAPVVAERLGSGFRVTAASCASEVGSGTLPLETLASAALTLRPAGDKASGRRLQGLAAALRRLPVPVVGRIAEGALWLDLRCLEDEAGFAANLAALDRPEAGDGLG